MAFLALLLLTILPRGPELRERVDVIEANVVYAECSDNEGTFTPIYTQFLFREWKEETQNHEIIAWRMLKSFPIEEFERPEGMPVEFRLPVSRRRTLMAPRLNQQTGFWEMRWFDGDVERVVEARTFVETVWVGDREAEERERFPREKRRELRKGR